MLFGAAGWLVAHALTYWLLEHAHVSGVRHVHGGEVTRSFVVAGCLITVSLLALFGLSLWRPDRGRSRPAPAMRISARTCSRLSTAAFVAVEFAEHSLRQDHPLPPVTVLLIGGLLQAAAGTGAALLWRECAGTMRRLAARLHGRRAADDSPIPTVRPQPSRPSWHSRRCTDTFAGRAPPALLR